MYLHNDLDDTENQFQWWLGELGHYLLTEYKMNIISMLVKNPDIAVKSAQLMKEEFMKGTDPRDFGDSIVPLAPHLNDFTEEVDQKT